VNQFWSVLPWAVAAPVLLLACSASETSTCNRAATCGGAPHDTGIDPGSGETSNASSGRAAASAAGAGGASRGGDSGSDPIGAGGDTSSPIAGGSSGENDGGQGGDGGGAGDGGGPGTETRDAPTVLILLDGSTSMLEQTSDSPTPWSIVQDALMDERLGALKPFEDRIRFGFTAYRGSNTTHAENDPQCATFISVDFGLDNYDAIQTTFAAISNPAGSKWETPTGHVVRRVTEQLLSDASPGKKYILLLTDGAPGTCQVLDPSCGQDLAIAAVQAAYSQGIATRTIGLFGDEPQNTGCEPQWGRCGVDHIQDLANAGSGQPVHAPPDTYIYQACAVADSGGAGRLTAEYALDSGTAPALTANSAAALASLLQMQFQEMLEE